MAERQPFDDYNPELFPRLSKAAHFISGLFSMDDSGYHSDHERRGAAEMLDAALDKPVQGTFDWTQPPFERQLGHEIMHGHLTAEDALRALETHDVIARPDEV